MKRSMCFKHSKRKGKADVFSHRALPAATVIYDHSAQTLPPPIHTVLHLDLLKVCTCSSFVWLLWLTSKHSPCLYQVYTCKHVPGSGCHHSSVDINQICEILTSNELKNSLYIHNSKIVYHMLSHFLWKGVGTWLFGALADDGVSHDHNRHEWRLCSFSPWIWYSTSFK